MSFELHRDHSGGRIFHGSAETPEEISAIAKASKKEAREKDAAIRAFYEQPNPNEAPWHLPRIHWDYLRQWKPEGKKRKDGATEDALHEANPILQAKTAFEREILPDQVTYEVIDGRKRELHPEQRSISILFSSFAIHDIDEEDPDSSRDTLIEFSNDSISDVGGLSKKEEKLLRAQTLFIADISDALTFGKKVRRPDGSIIKVPTHGDDLSLYTRALKDVWPGIPTKTPDREWGLVTRRTRIPIKKFTPDKDWAYLSETGTIFMEGQPIEDTIERFPQLAPFLEIANMRLRIAFTVMNTMTKYHPELSQKFRSRKGVYNPNTAEISIHRQMEKAMELAPWTTSDTCSFIDLMQGITAEASRHPTLQPIVDRVEEQMQPFLQQISSQLVAKPF